jgi:gluconolactonase
MMERGPATTAFRGRAKRETTGSKKLMRTSSCKTAQRWRRPALAARLLCLAWLLLSGMAMGQDYSKSEISEIYRGLRFTDGVAWSPVGYLLFSDVPTNRILRYQPGGEVRIFRDNAGGAAGNAFDKRGNLYTAETLNRRVTRTEGSTVTPLATEYGGKPFHGPNDLAVRSNGDVYFTDPAYGSAKQKRAQPQYGVYRISAKGEVSLVEGFSTRVNGIAFSPDEDTIYVSDSDRRLVIAIEITGKGEAKQTRQFVAIPDAIPAGLCVDKRGSVYVAAGQAIRIFDKTGKVLGRFNVPEEASDCTFGEADGKALFVTARGGVYRLQSPVEGLLPR